MSRFFECVGFTTFNEEETSPIIEYTYPLGYFEFCKHEAEEFIRKIHEMYDSFHEHPPRSFSRMFAMQNRNGKTLFCTAHLFYQKSKLNESYGKKSVFVISEHQKFYCLDIFARMVYMFGINGNVESGNSLLQKMICSMPEIDSTCFQKFEITLSPEVNFSVEFPPFFYPPFLHPEIFFIFSEMSSLSLAKLFYLLLTEKQVIIVSSELNQITPFMEFCLSSLYPLSWCHVYMPLASKRFAEETVKSGLTCFLGMSRIEFDTWDLEEKPGLYIADLDIDDLRYPQEDQLNFLPQRFINQFFVWVAKAYEGYPSKKCQKKMFEIVFELLFGDRLLYLKDDKHLDRNEDFFKQIDKTTMFRNYLESKQVKSEVYLNEKRDSEYAVNICNALQTYYEEIFETPVMTMRKNHYQKLPLMGLTDNINNFLHLNEFKLTKKQFETTPLIQPDEKAHFNTVVAEGRCDRHNVTLEALKLIRTIYGPAVTREEIESRRMKMIEEQNKVDFRGEGFGGEKNEVGLSNDLDESRLYQDLKFNDTELSGDNDSDELI